MRAGTACAQAPGTGFAAQSRTRYRPRARGTGGPAYLFQLEKVRDVVEMLRAEATQHKVALVDYTDAEVDDLRKPLSHACVLRHVLLGCDPLERALKRCRR